MTRIVLIGFMGSGKSAVGRALARRLNVPLLDTDLEIERRAGKTVPQIFAEDGEAAFRTAETAVLRELCESSASRVVAVGGGTPMADENPALLRQMGTIVWLTATPETIWARVGRTISARPLLADAPDPLARIAELLLAREPRYAALADLQIPTGQQETPDTVAARILRSLSSGPMESHVVSDTDRSS